MAGMPNLTDLVNDMVEEARAQIEAGLSGTAAARYLNVTQFDQVRCMAAFDDPETLSTVNVADMAALTAETRVSPEFGGADIQGVRALDGNDTAKPSADEVAAHGLKVLSNGVLAADLLVVPPGAGFPVHVHPGHHLLLALTPGTFTLAGVTHHVDRMDLTMVQGDIPHAVGNPYDMPHILVAIGSPPKELDAEDRMTLVDWDGEPVLKPAGWDAPDAPDEAFRRGDHDGRAPRTDADN